MSLVQRLKIIFISTELSRILFRIQDEEEEEEEEGRGEEEGGGEEEEGDWPKSLAGLH